MSDIDSRRDGHTCAPSNCNSRTSLIGTENSSKPIGIRIFGYCFKFSSQQSKRTYHKALVLLMTYIAYTAFHMGRRPLSIVKNVLNRNCSAIPNHNLSSNSLLTTTQDNTFNVQQQNLSSASIPFLGNETTDSCSWAPFDDDATANQLLAVLDTSFLLSYAIFMFFSGILAERLNLRYFISIGSFLSGIGLILFGLAYPFNIHSLTYFMIVQIASGAAQTTGWPVVVTCVSNWFEPAKRGLIYGLWNSHTNVGNILGATIAGFFVEKDWGLSFIVPGIIMIAVGLLMFLFLVPKPRDVDMNQIAPESATIKIVPSGAAISSYDIAYQKGAEENQRESVVNQKEGKAVSFFTALKIPGVFEYSMCLFFSKLVSYTFLYWLPRYITSSTSSSSEDSAYLSTPFDIGGVAGAILAGYVSDKFKASGITCNIMLVLAIPSMFAYQNYGTHSTVCNIVLQLVTGALINGPYCLITTAVSADLGNRVTDGRAMATVAAIIDGMGSVGAVLGPLFAGFVSNSGDWQAVFMMLIIADILASFCLIRVTINEIKQKLNKNNSQNLASINQA